jgi:hypothetical protein
MLEKIVDMTEELRIGKGIIEIIVEMDYNMCIISAKKRIQNITRKIYMLKSK